MDERILKWLFDIKMAVEEVNLYFESTDKSFHEYQNNKMLKRAVERNLEIIGEAVNRIIKRDASFAEIISNSKAIVGLRNQVIHAYDNISDENIWSIIISHLPKLKSDVDKLILENK
ncbi:HepT-like ribonuclease domain-containing protein [Aestuariivivens insulae]|uniref:HepT-like ribonuclease domain-containing protein n=1 Tax=Aestuariivivens insulae TaxID=1621988 RepID=UPI001F560F7B|nr:HepT-like ribonuclease domain-containing protein [Aestuariivivens insulae]